MKILRCIQNDVQAHRNGDKDFQKKIKDDLNKAGIDKRYDNKQD